MTEDVERIMTAYANVAARIGAPVCADAHAPTERGLDQRRIFRDHGVDLSRVMLSHDQASFMDQFTNVAVS